MASRFSKCARTSISKNVWTLVVWFVSCAPVFAANDAHRILAESLEAGDRNAPRVKSYSARSRVVEKQTDANGAVRSETVKSYEPTVIDGVLVKKLVAKNDRPLTPEDARKEEERVRKIARERKNESASTKAKRLEEQKKKRDKDREFNQEILDAFTFQLAGEEAVAGRKNWVIEATPRPGYEPKEMRAKIFPHLKGKIWIDEEDKLWTKADAMGINPFSVGFGMIAKLEQGAHLYFEQTRMEDGTWMLKESGLHAVAFVAVVKRIGIDQVTTLQGFQKVPSGIEVDDSKEK